MLCTAIFKGQRKSYRCGGLRSFSSSTNLSLNYSIHSKCNCMHAMTDGSCIFSAPRATLFFLWLR